MPETIGYLILAGAEAAGAFAAEAAVATAGGWVTTTSVSAAAIGGQTIFAGLTVAGAIGTAAVLGASVAVAFATAPEVPRAGDGSQPLRQAIPPRLFGYGRCRLAGAYMLFEVDDAGESWDVLALHQGRVEDIVHVYLHDDLVQLSPTGFVNGLLNLPDSDTRYNHSAANLVQIKFNLGADAEIAFADVTAVLPTLWTSDHRGDGVASMMLHCIDVSVTNVLKNYPRQLPKPSVVGDLSPIWDPRDEAQDREDPDTWAVSSNPVLQLLDYLTHADRGPALDYATLIEPVIDNWMAEADLCDAAVDKADGSTEPRYKSDGWAFLTTDPAEVINAILATCDGWLTESGDGTLALTVGAYRDPDITLTDDHIIEFELQKGLGDEDLVNEVQITYTAPQANWRDCPAVAYRDEDSISELGVVRSQRLQLAWVQSHSQARRLAKRALARHVAPARGAITTTLYGLRCLGKRWIAVESSEIADLADAVIEVTRVRIDLASARVMLEWTLVDPDEVDAWDPETEEGEPPAYFPVPENVTASDAGAGNEINVEFDAVDPAQPWLWYVIDYRLGTSGPWTRVLRFAQDDLTSIGGGRVRLVTDAVSAGTYSVRIAATGRQLIDSTPYWRVGEAELVDAASTGNLILSGEQAIDGVAVVAANRVLVKDQSNPANNGIYTVAAGAWTRIAAMDTWAETPGLIAEVSGGTVNGGTKWVSMTSPSGTLGVTAITFALIGPDQMIDPDLVWSPSIDGTSVIIS
jgi:hypothetical protein